MRFFLSGYIETPLSVCLRDGDHVEIVWRRHVGAV